jgi:outer membrane protein assembly factor BamB
MNKKRFFLLTLILLLGGLLSACSGATAASSWPGLSTDQNTAYLAYNQEVYAVNVADGNLTEQWRFPNPVNNKISFYAPPAMSANKQLLAGGFDHILYSLNSDNGSQVWAFAEAKDRYIAAPLVTDKAIFAPNADWNLYALDLNGKLLWTFKTGEAL